MKNLGKIFLFLLVIPAIALAMPASICVTNQTSKHLGNVTLHYPGGQSDIIISGTGNWTTSLPGNATAITIHNQRCEYPGNKVMTLPSGSKIKVTWKQQNLIEVIDIATQG